MSDLVGYPKYRFSRDAAHLKNVVCALDCVDFRDQETRNLKCKRIHAIMKLPHHCYESEWTIKPGLDFPGPITTDLSKALVGSTNVIYRSTICPWDFI